MNEFLYGYAVDYKTVTNLGVYVPLDGCVYKHEQSNSCGKSSKEFKKYVKITFFYKVELMTVR